DMPVTPRRQDIAAATAREVQTRCVGIVAMLLRIVLNILVGDDDDFRVAVLENLFAIAVFSAMVRGYKHIDLAEVLSEVRSFQHDKPPCPLNIPREQHAEILVPEKSN